MASEQLSRPETYGDVFGPGVGQDLAHKPIVREDAAAMQSAENQVLGQTLKGGAASLMTSAADRSVNRGVLRPDAASQVEPPGMTVVARTTGGGTGMEEMEYVQGVPVVAGRVVLEASGAPQSVMTGVGMHIDINPLLAGGMGGDGGGAEEQPLIFGETIGEALETAAVLRGEKEVTAADARAVHSAEARATGQMNVPGGPASAAQAAAGTGARLFDVLQDATERLPTDKVVTQADASAVMSAEQRNNMGRAEPGGVAASVQQAADLNKNIGAV